MNVIFTNPFYLFGAFFSLIPLIIHIFYKRKIKTVRFSSLQFIKLSHTQNSKKFHLKEWLLLLIRTLILLFLILSAANPILKTNKGKLGIINSNKNKRIVIIIDNSLSMGYTLNSRSLFDIAIKKGHWIIDNMYHKGDIVSIIPSASLNDYIYTELYTKDKIKKKIDGISLSFGKAKIMKSLKLVQSHLSSGLRIDTTVYLISDFQNSNFSNAINRQQSDSYQLVLIDVGPKENFNVAIKSASIPSLFYGLQKTIPIHLTLKNTGNLKGTIISKVILNNQKIDQQSVMLKGQETKYIRFDSKLKQAGTLFGHIVLDGDKLKYDNGYYFVDYIPESLKVLIVDDFHTSQYLQNVFNSIQYNKTIQYRVISSRDIDSTINQYDVLIFNSLKRILPQQNVWVKQFLNHNKLIFFFLNPNLDINNFNNTFYLNDIVPIRLLNTISVVNDSSNYFPVKNIDYNHKALSVFQNYNFFSTLKIYSYYKIDYDISNPNLSILARLDNTAPYLIEYNYTDKKEILRGKVFILTTDIFNKMSDIVYHPNFPVLIFQLLRYGIKQNTAQFFPYTSIETIKNTIDAKDNVAIQQFNFLTKQFDPYLDERVKLPGIYKIGQRYFTVNVAPEESNLNKATEKELKNKLGHFYYIKDADNFNTEMSHISQGRSLTSLLIALSLILLIIEIFVANKVSLFRSK